MKFYIQNTLKIDEGLWMGGFSLVLNVPNACDLKQKERCWSSCKTSESGKGVS